MVGKAEERNHLEGPFLVGDYIKMNTKYDYMTWIGLS
jgi:hypothetical protein